MIGSSRAGAVPSTYLQDLFQRQQASRWRVAATSAAQRREKLRALKRAFVASLPALKEALAVDLQRSAVETEIIEIQPVLVELNDAIHQVGRWMRPRRATTPLLLFGSRSEIRYEPRGNVLILAPWNYPVYLALGPLIAAVAAGNCVILKGSEKGPASAAYLTGLISSVFEADEVAAVEGDVSVAIELLELPFDHIFFTGSTATGKKVMAAAAKNLASVTLELGGKSPVIVDSTADLDRAAERIVWGKFINAGQTCVAPDYVLAEAGVAERLAGKVVEKVRRFYGERAHERDFAGIVDTAAVRRIDSLILDATKRGARVVASGIVDEEGRRVGPTVLLDVDPAASIMKEEIFGPALPIVPWKTTGDLISQLQAGEKPLALYIFSKRSSFIREVLSRTTSGGVAVNAVVLHLTNPWLPFGGVGASGMGSYHGEYGFKAFSHERSVLRQGRIGFLQYFYPPYSPRVARMAALVTRFLGGRA